MKQNTANYYRYMSYECRRVATRNNFSIARLPGYGPNYWLRLSYGYRVMATNVENGGYYDAK